MDLYLVSWNHDGIIGTTRAASEEEALEKARALENSHWNNTSYSKEEFLNMAWAIKVSDIERF